MRSTALYCPAPAERARLLLAQGKVEEAARWTEGRGLAAEDELSYPREGDYLVLARALLALGAAGQAGGSYGCWPPALPCAGGTARRSSGQGR